MNYRHILLIEDDEGICLVTKFSLEMDKIWLISTASCGREGIIKAQTIHPDIILLDLMMPDRNGLEILKELKSDRMTMQIPVILFTAKTVDKEITELIDNHLVKGIITKPFDSLALSTKIEYMLSHQPSLQKSPCVRQ